jgi:hypothetical protein
VLVWLVKCSGNEQERREGAAERAVSGWQGRFWAAEVGEREENLRFSV